MLIFLLSINPSLTHTSISCFQNSGTDKPVARRKMTSTISLPSFRLPSKAKFWKKRRSEDLTDSDPSYRAIYLGNVLTGWAKGKIPFQKLVPANGSYGALC